jgi:subfamily B ATP-binding cassette protein MsbA
MRAWLRHIRGLASSVQRLRPHMRGGRYLIMAVVASSLLAAMLEGLGVAMLIPLLNLLQESTLPQSRLQMSPVRIVQEYLPNHSPGFYLIVFCALVVLAFVAKNIVFYFSQLLAARLRRRISTNLRLSLFERLHNAEMHVFEQRSGGEMSNVFATETVRTIGTVEVLINLLQRVSVGVCYLAALFWISWQLTCFVFLLGLLVGGSLLKLYRRLSRVGGEVTDINQQLYKRLAESFSGVRVVRATNSQGRVIGEFKQESENLAMVEEKISRTSALLGPVAEVVAVAGAMVVVGCAYVYLVRPGFMLPSYLAGFGFCLLRLLPLVNQVYGLQGNFIYMSWGVKEVERWLDSPQFPQRPFGQVPLEQIKDGIVFEQVGYTYGNGKEALAGISFKVPAGKTVALVGASGSGKSTIAALLLRFREPTAGRITLDGRDYWEYTPESWHRHVAFVDQEAFLFHDTLSRNIAYGFTAATPEAIASAVEIARLNDVVEALPDGLDTIVGERGTLLSGGQLQRLAIARALVRRPHVLVLDEATSALDNISEREVQEALEKAQRGRTVVVIAHRLTTIQRADHIVVMDKGRVVEEGTWLELAAKKGAFARLLEAANRETSVAENAAADRFL